jgi:hypothetical protein
MWREVAVCAACTAVLAAVPPARADTLVAKDRAVLLTAPRSAVVWDRTDRRGAHRLVMLRAGRTRTLPIPPSRGPLVASAGTARSGRPVLVYSRCNRRLCTSIHIFSLSNGHDARAPVSAEPGCDLAPASMDRGVLVFLRRGPCPDRGVWRRTAAGRLRRLQRVDDVCCTAVWAGRAAWIGGHGDRVSVTVAPARGRPFAIFQVRQADYVVGSLHALDGRLYWSLATRSTPGAGAHIFRSRMSRGAACEMADRRLPVSSRSDPWLDFAVNETSLWYRTGQRILRADQPRPSFEVGGSLFPGRAPRGPGCS